MKKEYWRPIVGYEGLYEVSNFGRVKSLNYNHTGKEKIMKPNKDKGGYLKVGLCKNGKRYQKLVHRLVAEAFLSNPYNLPEVNHINEVKTDNRVQNIEYCDRAYNSSYGTRNERIAKTEMNHPKKSKIVFQYSLDGTFIKEFPSVSQIEREIGFSHGNISRCCRGEFKQVYGYIWRYKDSHI